MKRARCVHESDPSGIFLPWGSSAGVSSSDCKPILNVFIDEVLDTVGRLVEVVIGQFKVLGHVGFPQPVSPHE